MQLSGPQVKQIHEALLDGYSLDTLRVMVRIELGENLEAIAKQGDLSTVAFGLIEWAERTNRVPDLIAGALAQQPSSALISALHEQVQEWDLSTTGGRPTPAKTSLIEFDWVTIPAGEFLYGDDKQRVYLDTFQISRTPVTNRQYQMFVDATGHKRPVHWEGRRVHPTMVNHPVVFVSWDDAQAFCDWAGVFLPTEPQWEKAARGTDGREYPWGDEPPTDKLCNFNRNVGTTTPVGRYSPQGDSPYGVADMAGNAWEWCEGWYDSDHQYHPLRGGSFWNVDQRVRCAYRLIGPPGYWVDYFGFRVVVSSPG